MSAAERRRARPNGPGARARPAGLQGFPKQRRLRKRREFLAVQSRGRAIHGRYFLVVAAVGGRSCEGQPRGGRVGITVSKKVGSAVKRNRIKRLVREYVRSHDLPIAEDLVVIAKRSAARLTGYGEVAQDLDRLAERLS